MPYIPDADDEITGPLERGYRIAKKGDDVTVALTAGDLDVAIVKVGDMRKALTLVEAWERSL